MKLAVGLGRVSVDAAGLHWPETVSVAYLTTINAPPWCAISEPEITVDLERKGLSIACKLTPPIPEEFCKLHRKARQAARSVNRSDAKPDGNQGSKVKEGVEFDQHRVERIPVNPWLKFIYVHGELGGTLRDRELFANGWLRVLQQYDAATVHLSSNFANRSIRGTLESRPVPLSGWPEFRGDLRISQREASIEAETSVAGCRVDGQLKLVSHPDIRFGLLGRADIPVVGRTVLRGSSDPRFRQPEVFRLIQHSMVMKVSTISCVIFMIVIHAGGWFTYSGCQTSNRESPSGFLRIPASLFRARDVGDCSDAQDNPVERSGGNWSQVANGSIEWASGASWTSPEVANVKRAKPAPVRFADAGRSSPHPRIPNPGTSQTASRHADR